ncbi:peptidoglycan-binding domain-containing protein [Bacillus swezeyi]|uniref:peptidoglycan-binding domain-containing protein n=1 Tax=Bacillus swezeyi TaxID=1925020 RepID=UPI0039C6DEA9
MLICKGYEVNGLDSIFGSGLEKAVKAFQKAKGLSVDGIAGKATWTKVFVS